MPSVGLTEASTQRRERPNLGIKTSSCIMRYFYLASVSSTGGVSVTLTPQFCQHFFFC